MTASNSTALFDGLTLGEHRDLGRAFTEIVDALDMMASSSPDGRRAEYEHMSMEVDLILDECADMFLDAYEEATGESARLRAIAGGFGSIDGVYPYPRYSASSDPMAGSRRQFEHHTLDCGLPD